MDLLNLNSFLKFGYFMKYKFPNYSLDFSNINKKKYLNFCENDLINIGQNLWFETVSKQITQNNENVVPLSGGLDSRAILGSLLEHKNASEINTYTFGTPNTLDFEIGNKIAKTLGTKHRTLSLSNYEYNTNDLVNISDRIDNQTLLFLHPSIKEIDLNYSQHDIWSGAVIDVFFGRHSHSKKSKNLTEGLKNCISENIFVKSVDLTNVSDIELSSLFDYDSSLENYFIFEHVLDLMNRQLKFIAPHVLMKGFNYKTMLSPDLTNFAMSIDNKFHENQYIYKKIFLKAFPYLFSLPDKTSNGVSLNSSSAKIYLNKIKRKINALYGRFDKNYVNPGTNYIDFNRGIRDRNDLKKVIYENINDLKSRKILPWINIDEIWKNHINNKNNHGDALLTLASLEIHLKAGKKI